MELSKKWAMNIKNSNKQQEQRALDRYSAVLFIQNRHESGEPLARCFQMAAKQQWGNRFYTVSSLQQWYYAFLNGGFDALKVKGRSDKGKMRSLTNEACKRLQELRRGHPNLHVTSLVRQLIDEHILETGEFSLSSIYRYFQKIGLNDSHLKLLEGLEAGKGPTKAFEKYFANEVWMTDMMVGPTLSIFVLGKPRAIRTRLFAFIDDASRVCTHGKYYSSESLECLLDTLKKAMFARGIPEAIYTDNGKVFTCHHLKIICANLECKLLHAKPYSPFSKKNVSYCTSLERSENRMIFYLLHSFRIWFQIKMFILRWTPMFGQKLQLFKVDWRSPSPPFREWVHKTRRRKGGKGMAVTVFIVKSVHGLIACSC